MVQKNREITLTTETVKLIYLIQFSRSFGHELSKNKGMLVKLIVNYITKNPRICANCL